MSRVGRSQLDQQLGSILEAWVTQETGDRCRFCRQERVRDASKNDRFCSEGCREDFKQVQQARLALGQRDLEQRGYD